VVEELEESFGGDFFLGFSFVLDEMNEFPNVCNGKPIILRELFSGKNNRLSDKKSGTFCCSKLRMSIF
jgi:hypothetical protein